VIEALAMLVFCVVLTSCTGSSTFAVAGTVSGLSGSGLILEDNGTVSLAILTNGRFEFKVGVLSGGAYNVTVQTQPSNPAQTCTVANGSGTATAEVTNVQVKCEKAATTYTIGGTVSGLNGTGLVLLDNGGNNLAVTANGSFTFTAAINGGSNYNVSVGVEPSNPAQNCVVSNGSGIATANVANVQVACTNTTYTIGGAVSGLAGSGLTLLDNGGNTMPINANGSFTFTTPVASGAAYAVTVGAQPSSPAQNCIVSNGSGTATANVTGVQVTCSTVAYTIGGTVSGLTGSGLVLQDNGGDNLAVTANGAFTFATKIPSGSAYSVTVHVQPSSPSETCVVTSGSGTVATSNVTNVALACTTNTYAIGGTVSGLSGAGLVLEDNGGDNLSITGNGSFTFTTKIASGNGYAVTVHTQPSSPAQNCTIANGSGTASANVTNVTVTCTTATSTYTVGGTLTGLSGSGLVLEDNGGDNLTVTAGSTSFTFATKISTGSNYAVTVFSQPSNPAQTCTVTNGSGTVSGGNITNISIACATAKFSLSGTIDGLTTSGLVLTDTTDNLSAAANSTTFTFPTSLAEGTSYTVAVVTQPTGLNCTVTNGTGTMPASDVTSVQVTCAAITAAGEWTWEFGENSGQANANYGTMGVPAAGNVPGARVSSVTWTDASGNLWMWGGYGVDSQFSPGNLNDLWEYSPSTGQWVWVNGSNINGQAGVYGTKGTPAASNVPGAREGAMSWTDNAGNFWLFGGDANISSTGNADFNDLWKYDPATGIWTWISGSSNQGAAGNYGTQGVAAASNVPGARDSAVTWTDLNGNLWLFGGNSFNGDLNDLWEFAPSTGLWTWVAGSSTNTGVGGVYGTMGTAAPTNAPGSRFWATSWADSKGNLWLFGGVGRASGTQNGHLNDLWKFTISTGEWTWMSGSDLPEASGVYGTMGTPAATNVPGARYVTASWVDSSDDLWFFGGSCGLSCPNGGGGYFSDLWKYSTASGEWTWVNGPDTMNDFASYGTLGVASASNVPGAREEALCWHAAGNGALWMFGGYGYASSGNSTYLNDVWKFVP
jgi:N-acetylneuraminic acid mutarotase